jgi:CubicO group peptidase (beta-lactamase class C family)
MVRRVGRGLLAAALSLGAAIAPIAVLAQTELPPPLLEGEPSEVPPAVQLLRWRMNDADINSLTFRSMDTLFNTRSVPRSGPIWRLEKSERPLEFSYTHEGQSYTPEQFLDRTYTDALMVMKDGRIVYENYRNNSNERTRFMGWSMTKSLTSILVGLALEQGKIRSIDDRIETYLPELQGGGYEGATIRQILQMRSGVSYEERYDFENPGTAASNHISALVKNVSRFADPARTIARAHGPGEEFEYKTLDTAVLGWLLERVTDGNVAAYMAQHLWEPLGAEYDGFFIMDGPPGAGREFTGAGFNATLRDYARVGLMMLDGGRGNGRQIVPAEWVTLSTQPFGDASRGSRSGYGMQWWTFGDSAYSAVGLQGQFIYVDPATRTVVVKLSHFPPGTQGPEVETAAFFAAASAWLPN